MSNPYKSPDSSFSDDLAPPIPDIGLRPGLVGHVRIVAILMIVQGTLEILMGVFLACMGVFMAFAMESSPAIQQQGGGPGPPPQAFFWIMFGTYGVMGLIHIVAGSLHLFAGIKNYRFRSRTLGFAALGGGLMTLLGCYCLPTAVALAIYGLIVYVDSSVALAFEMGEQGQDADGIASTFAGYQKPPGV